MVKSEEDNSKHRRRRKKRTDVIKLIDPEDTVVLLSVSSPGNGGDDVDTSAADHSPELLTLSPVKVRDEVYKKNKKKKIIFKESEGNKTKQLKMSPTPRKRIRPGGSKRKISQSSDSEAEVSRTGLSENQSATGAPTMDTCTLCLKEMTAHEFRRHNRLPHDQPCTVQLCPLRFSDASDLQTHRRTAHFLANSKRKSWVASAEDQCPECDKTFSSQKKLLDHQERYHGLREGGQVGYPLQEIQPQETIADKELTTEHPEPNSKYLEPENKGAPTDKKHVQNNGKNKAFYARLDQENIKECPFCLHYYDDLHYDKHRELLHEHACRSTQCKAKFEKISNECIHSHRYHPDIKVFGRQPCKQCKYCQQFVDGKSIGSHEKATHSVKCPDCSLKFAINPFMLVNHRVYQHILPLFSGNSNQPDNDSDKDLDQTCDEILDNIETNRNLSKEKSKTEDCYATRPKNKKGRPPKQKPTANVSDDGTLKQGFILGKKDSCKRAKEGWSMQAKESSSMQAKEGRSMQAKEGRSMQAMEGSSMQAKEGSSMQAKKSSSIQAKKVSSLQAKKSSSMQDKEDSSIQVKEDSWMAETSKGQLRRGRSTSQDEVDEDPIQLVNKVSEPGKKKRSRSGQQDQQINIKRSKGDGEQERPTVKKELRRSQDTIIHGIREIWTTPIKKEEIKSEQISTINLDDLQDFSISSTFDETACSTSQNLQHSQEFTHSDYQPSQRTRHTTNSYRNQDFFGETSYQSTPQNMTTEPGFRSCEVQEVPSSFQFNQDILDLDFPLSSGFQSSQGTHFQSYYQSSKSLHNVNHLSNSMVVKSDPDIEPFIPSNTVPSSSSNHTLNDNLPEIHLKKEEQSVPANSDQSRVPVPLVPYAIDSESEMSSADEEASDNFVPTVTTSIAQSILKVKQELKEPEDNKKSVKIEKVANEEKGLEDYFKEFSEDPVLDHVGPADNGSTLFSGGYQHKEVPETNTSRIKEETKSKDLVINDINLKEDQSVIKNAELFETEAVEGDSMEELNDIEAMGIPNSGEVKYDSNEIETIDIKHERIDSSVTSYKSNAVDSLKENKKISIKFKQKSLASQIPETTAPVLEELDFLTSVSQDQAQNSLLSKVHMFEGSGVVEAFNKDEDIFIIDNENESFSEGSLPDVVNVLNNSNKADVYISEAKTAETVKVTLYKDNIERGSFESEITGNEAHHLDIKHELHNKSTCDNNSLRFSSKGAKNKPVLEDIKPVLNAKLNNELNKEQISRGISIENNKERPSVIMETRTLLDNCYSKPSSQVPDIAKIMSSMPKIPKKERVVNVMADNSRSTPPRQESRHKKSKNVVIEEKTREVKPKAFKDSKRKEIVKEGKEIISPIFKEKTGKRKRGRPKKEDKPELNFDLTAQLDDLEKSIREEENDEKDANEDNYDRNLQDEKVLKSDKTEGQKCQQTLEDNVDTKSAIQGIHILNDSDTIESEEQSMEAIKELILLGANTVQSDDRSGIKSVIEGKSKKNNVITESSSIHDYYPSVTEDTSRHDYHYSAAEDTSSNDYPSVTEDTSSHDYPCVTKYTSSQGHQSVTEEISILDHQSVTEDTISQDNPSITEGTSSHDNPSVNEDTSSHDNPSVTEDISSPDYPSVTEGTSGQRHQIVTEDTISQDHHSVTEGTSSHDNPCIHDQHSFEEVSRSHNKLSVTENNGSHKIKVQKKVELFYDSSDDEIGKFSPIPVKIDNEEIIDGCNEFSYSNNSSAKTKVADDSSDKTVNIISSSNKPVIDDSSLYNDNDSSASHISFVDLTASPQAAKYSRRNLPSSKLFTSSSKDNNDDIELINIDSSPSKNCENMESISAFITSSTSYDDRFVMTPNDASKISDGIIDDLLAESDEDDGVLAEKWNTTTSEDTAPCNDKYSIPSNNRQPSSSLSYACLPLRNMSENLRSLALDSTCLKYFGQKQLSSSDYQKSSEMSSSLQEETSHSEDHESSNILMSESPELSILSPKTAKKYSRVESPKSSKLAVPKFSKIEIPKSFSPTKFLFSPHNSSSPVSSPRSQNSSPAKKKKRKKSSVNREKCPICELEMKTSAEYSTHIKQDHSKSCIYCPLKFTYNHGLEDHIASQHNAEADIHNSSAWHCNKCDKNFNREKVFIRHVAMDHKHKCAVKKCKMAFVFSADLSAHNASSHKKGKTEKIKAIPTEPNKLQSNRESIKSNDANIFSPKSGSPLINANLKSFTIPKNTTKSNADLSEAQKAKTVVVESGGEASNLSEICELCQTRMTMDDFMEHIDLDHNFNCSDDKCGLSFVDEDSKLEHEFQAHGLRDQRGTDDEQAATISKQGYTTASGGNSNSLSTNQSALKNTSDSDICIMDDSVHQDDKTRVGMGSAEADDCHNSSLSFSCDEWETDMMRKLREEKTCFLCDKKFENQGDYERHMAYDHDDEYTMPVDNKEKEMQQDNIESPGDEVKVPIQKCHLCKQPTDDILKHLHTFHDKTKQVTRDNHSKCRQCEARFSNTIEYLKHSEIKHKFPCKNCKLTFTKDIELTAHTAEAHGAVAAGSSRRIAAGALTCEQCGYEMNNRNLYDRHMVKVHSIHCTQLDCNYMFVTHLDLKDHLTNVHLVRYIQIGDNYEAKLIPGRSKKNAVIMPIAEKWISSKKAMERMRAITRGEFESTRHKLFFDRKEREQCNGQNSSNLNNMANGSFFREFDEMETKILAQIKEQVVEPMIQDGTADLRLIQLFKEKDLGSSYTHLVLCPEIFVYLYQERFKMSRGEAENQFLEIHTDKETLESIKKGTYGQETDRSSKESTPVQSDEEEEDDDF